MPLTIRQLGPLGLRRELERVRADEAEQQRRLEYTRRHLVLIDRYEPLVHRRLAEVYSKGRSIAELSKFASAGSNVMGRVVREVAYVYTRTPSRRLRAGGPLGAALNQRLAASLEELQIATRAKGWARWAFALNVAWIVPACWERQAGLQLDTTLVLPHTAERLWTDDIDTTDVLMWPGASDGWLAVDAEAYYWLDKHHLTPTRIVPHLLGYCPAIELRLSEHPPGDYWDIGRGHRLLEATIEVGRIAAAMALVRRAQNRKLVTAFGQTERLDRDQVALPEDAVTASTDDGDALAFAVHDFVTSVDQFVLEMRWWLEQTVESYGIPVSTIDPAEQQPTEGSPSLHAAKAEVRAEQIDFARPFDRKLVASVHDLAARHRHRYALAPELVRETYEVRWPPMTYVEAPIKRLDVLERKLALGLLTHADAMIEEYGDVTPEEAFARVMANLEQKARIDLWYAAHNVGQDPRVHALAQIQGRLGGLQQQEQTP